jgi:hypothetical protein
MTLNPNHRPDPPDTNLNPNPSLNPNPYETLTKHVEQVPAFQPLTLTLILILTLLTLNLTLTLTRPLT